jgi:hypothetical membrane protein
MTKHDTALAPPRISDRAIALVGILGVVAYVATWFIVGITRSGYVPTQQAISELFEFGAPTGGRVALSLALAVTGMLLIPFGFMLHRQLPGASRLGPWLIAYSGIMTAAVVAFPCTAGCPGYGSSFTDSMHVLTAGSGYVALVTAPIAVGWRLRPHDPVAARWSILLGTLALVGFVVRNAGVDDLGGLQQRVFNTTADLWVALIGVWVLRGRFDGEVSRRSFSRRG